MYDPATGKQTDDVPSTNGDISDPDKRFKRGYGIFAVVVLLVTCGVSGGSYIALLLATAGIGLLLAGIFALSIYDDARMLRRNQNR